jgi:hypothetical protein
MAILFVGGRASDLGGVTSPNYSATTFDAAFSTESAQVTPIFNGGAAGFNIFHDAAVSGVTWYHFYVRTPGFLASGNNDGHWFTMYDAANNPIARCDVLDANYRAQVFGDTTEVGTNFALSENTNITVDVKVEVGANITMEIYFNGGLLSSATAANTGAKPSPTLFAMEHDDIVYTSSGDEFYYSEVMLTDNENTLGWRLSTLVPGGQGAHADWEGDFSDLVNFGDGTNIGSATPNQKESWTLSAYSGPATSAGVRAVVNAIQGNVGVSGPTQIAPFVRFGGTDVEQAAYTPDGTSMFQVLDVNPVTGAPWDTADLATVEMGVKSIA